MLSEQQFEGVRSYGRPPIGHSQLVATNRGLNRRCQRLESEVARLVRILEKSEQAMREREEALVSGWQRLSERTEQPQHTRKSVWHPGRWFCWLTLRGLKDVRV